jgi:plasmid stabilization system protein ParE
VKYKVKTTKTASQHIRAQLAWWRANRKDAKRSLKKELDDALALIAEQPGIGGVAHNVEFEGTQRWHLHSLPYAVYYEVDDVKRIVYVTSFWPTKRGTGPDL